jgi:putative flippase GtrA
LEDNRKEVSDFLSRTAELRRYGVATLMSAGISVGLPIFLHEICGIEERPAFAIGLVCSFAFNFLSIKLFVFKSGGSAWRQLAVFALSSAVFRFLEYWLFATLMMTSFPYQASMLITLIVSFTAKFAIQKNLIFSRRGRQKPPYQQEARNR